MNWETEAALVADFETWVRSHANALNNRLRSQWVVYHETCGWDLVLVRVDDGFQIGVEAKLALNTKVLCQALEHDRYSQGEGPDCVGVLVPAIKTQHGLATLARRLGITVITADYIRDGWSGKPGRPRFSPALPHPHEGPPTEDCSPYGWI